MEHNPLPWSASVEVRVHARVVLDADGREVGVFWETAHLNRDGNVRRVLAAVNATDGIPTETLESPEFRDFLKEHGWIPMG